ncbi:MAG: 50S ribosomal protein L29 [Candidatus Nitrosotenuis sp.]
MARLKMKSIRELNAVDLKSRLEQSRVELSKLRMEAAKGTVKKESGKIRAHRKEVARMLTRLNELKKK